MFVENQSWDQRASINVANQDMFFIPRSHSIPLRLLAMNKDKLKTPNPL